MNCVDYGNEARHMSFSEHDASKSLHKYAVCGRL